MKCLAVTFVNNSLVGLWDDERLQRKASKQFSWWQENYLREERQRKDCECFFLRLKTFRRVDLIHTNCLMDKEHRWPDVRELVLGSVATPWPPVSTRRLMCGQLGPGVAVKDVLYVTIALNVTLSISWVLICLGFTFNFR